MNDPVLVVPNWLMPVYGPLTPDMVEPATLLPPKHAGGNAPNCPLVDISVTELMYIGKEAGFVTVRVPAMA